MKKFSKLITESNVDKDFIRHATVDNEDWKKIQPIIDLLKSEKYTENTRNVLKELISNINKDSIIYWQNNIKNKESFEDFFKMFGIDSDEDTIKDCIRDLIDNTEELYDATDDNKGEFIILMKGLRHKNIVELKEDIKDAFLKLEMIENTDFYLLIEVDRNRYLKLPKKLYDGRPADIDSWFELNNIISPKGQYQLRQGESDLNIKPDNIASISLHIYNSSDEKR